MDNTLMTISSMILLTGISKTAFNELSHRYNDTPALLMEDLYFSKTKRKLGIILLIFTSFPYTLLLHIYHIGGKIRN